MARETYAALQAKIEKEINKLQKKAEVLQTKRRKPVITSIINSMREYDITPEEIVAAYGTGKPVRAAAGGRRKAGAAGRPATAAKRAVAPKYRHPQTGETWSGRGKAPRWLAAEEASGATRDSFLIKE
ncbi:H-NS family nucleoid-associated regulatory protein [Achromobacter sp. UMC46]|uniref:H-NS histone family protein n=1 Tax=Achromobacter sp. UMC46 TaxID=1862319 RepID=UPI0015FEE6D9|nr:H-NS histone family protein [Achromobacter sp. UMC46]MBB1597032.1 DNA-binding protein [Achromobacter sp. UMC46]